MKKVRVISTAAMLALLSVGSMTFVSCSKTEDCAVGYEGKDCNVEIRTAMIGTYDAEDVRGGVNKNYVAKVSANSGNVTVVNIEDFGDFFSGNTEIVTSNISKTGNNISFTIPSQKPDGIYTVEGSGTYDATSKKITITYSISDGVQVNNATGTWTKR